MIRKMLVLIVLAVGMSATAGAEIWFPTCYPCGR